MATMTQNSHAGVQVMPLDVLWAFYQSQPKSVKKAFRTRMEAEENKTTAPWQQDLKEIKALKANWDEEGAPAINKAAIRNAQKLMGMISSEAASQMRLMPTRLGAVMIKLETQKGRIKGEVGDNEMSYFVKRQGIPTEHYSFEPMNKERLATLVQNLESIL